MQYIFVLVGLLFLLISGISKAIQDTSASAFSTSLLKNLNPKFWNKHASANNKWKNGNKSEGEKFWGSSRWFVFTTDAWHLFDVIRDLSLIIATLILLIGLYFTGNTSIFIFIILYVLIYIIRQTFFELVYININKK